MTQPRPTVFVTRALTEGVMARMADLFDARLNPLDMPPDRAMLAAGMAECDVLVPTITDRIDADLIAGAGDRLKLIANFGAGVDHIDLAAARARGILVTNTPGVLTEDTADLAMALILAVPRRISEGEQRVSAGQWLGWGPTDMLGHRVHGKKLGIIGMGRIGRAIARRAAGFRMEILYHNRHQLPAEKEAELGARWCGTVEQLLCEADIVSINSPHTPETHLLMNAARLALMQKHAVLINTARGEIIDEDALAAALESGQIAGAGLDVHAREPHVHPRLLKCPNAVLLPHMGSATHEGRTAMGEKVIANIRSWVDGHRPPDQVLEGWA